MTERVSWRGVTLDARTAAMMDEVAALTGSVVVQPSQGSWSGAVASAGTHLGCGTLDCMADNPSDLDVIVDAARRVGFAAWHRTPDQSDWPHHAHLVAVQPGGRDDPGCLAASAHDQIRDYYAGRNGLASGAPDDQNASREWVGMTFEAYIAAKPDDTKQEGDTMPWIVNLGDAGLWLTDFATYRCGIEAVAVADEGVTLGCLRNFAGREPLGQAWIDHVMRLTRTDAKK